jgi:hypothetical protein
VPEKLLKQVSTHRIAYTPSANEPLRHGTIKEDGICLQALSAGKGLVFRVREAVAISRGGLSL